MLIGIDANEANLTSHRVGINQYAFDLLHTFYTMKTPHSFTIYLKTPPLPDLPPEREGWKYRVIPFPRAWTQTRLPFDLYTHFPRPEVFLSLTHYAPRFAPMPTVVAIMDLGFLKFPDQFTRRDLDQLKGWTEYSVKQAAKVLAISEFTKTDIVNIYGKKSEDVVVTYPAYDQKLFKPTRNLKVLGKYHIREPYFLYLSSLKPSKNIEGLIRAFSQIPHAEYQLVIAGKKAWLYDQIFALVKELNLEEKVVFTGFVDEPEVPVLMTHASAFVMPSFYEGFGIPPLEAMACGCPVVISKVASLPEVAGEAGIYVDPHSIESIREGMIRAVGAEHNKFVKLSLSRVKSFSWQDTAKRTLETVTLAAR